MKTMMMMMIKRIFLVFCFAYPLVHTYTQETDYGIWTEVNTEFGMLKKLDAHASFSLRTFNNSSQVEQGFAEAGLQYRINRNLSVAGSYRLIKNIENDSKYYFRHKMFIDLKYFQAMGNLKMTARFRIQRAVKTYIEDEEDLLAKFYGRVKLKTEYDIPSFPITPFVYFESFTPVFADSGFEICKYRAAAGAELKISRRSSLEAGCIYQREFRSNIINSYFWLLSYNFKF